MEFEEDDDSKGDDDDDDDCVLLVTHLRGVVAPLRAGKRGGRAKNAVFMLVLCKNYNGCRRVRQRLPSFSTK